MESKATTRASKRLVLNNDDSNSIFLVPSDIVESYGEKVPSEVSFRLDDSGKKWIVSIEKFRDQYFFTDGWKEFAEQGDLKATKFLKFKYGKKERKRSGDGKATSSSPNKDKGENIEKRDCNVKATSSIPNVDKGEGSGVQKELTFCKEMKKHHRFRVDIPTDFVTATGLHREMEIKLKYGEGKEWPVRMLERVRSVKSTFTMSRGWNDFVRDNKNKLTLGSTVLFSWLSGNIVQVEILGVVTDKPSLYSIKDKRRQRLQNRDN